MLTSQKPKDSAYPTELRTLGDHLRKRRLDLGLLQREVADRLCVAVENVRNWEWNKAKPAVPFLPAIFGFLGYEPERPAGSFAEALRASRRAAGLSQEQLAKGAGLDESTIAKWERGNVRPMGRTADRLRQFFQRIGRPLPEFGPEELCNPSRRSKAARSQSP